MIVSWKCATGAILHKYPEIARQFQGNTWQSPGNLQGTWKFVQEEILVSRVAREHPGQFSDNWQLPVCHRSNFGQIPGNCKTIPRQHVAISKQFVRDMEICVWRDISQQNRGGTSRTIFTGLPAVSVPQKQFWTNTWKSQGNRWQCPGNLKGTWKFVHEAILVSRVAGEHPGQFSHNGQLPVCHGSNSGQIPGNCKTIPRQQVAISRQLARDIQICLGKDISQGLAREHPEQFSQNC